MPYRIAGYFEDGRLLWSTPWNLRNLFEARRALHYVKSKGVPIVEYKIERKPFRKRP